MRNAAIWLERGLWLLLGALLCAGTSAALAEASRPETIYNRLEVLAEVFAHIENHFVEPAPATELVYGAAQGAVSQLDEHSAFFDPRQYRELIDTTEGEYGGLGVRLVWSDGLPRIVTVVDGSPAQTAELRVGDHLLAVDGQPVRDMNLELIRRALRGRVGTRVRLRLRRLDRDEPWECTLIRGWIRVVPLERRNLGDGIEYVHLRAFSRRVATDLAGLLKKHPPQRGLILDLRSNPGGLFAEAVSVCDLFLASGPIVTAVGRGGQVVDRQSARARGTEPDYPLAVLIDPGSASAAEIVAGALSERGRARLFGSRSYGKGSVQSIIELSDGSGIKLTVAHYLTPSGRRIEGEGILPHEAVHPPSSPATLAAAASWLRQQAANPLREAQGEDPLQQG